MWIWAGDDRPGSEFRQNAVSNLISRLIETLAISVNGHSDEIRPTHNSRQHGTLIDFQFLESLRMAAASGADPQPDLTMLLEGYPTY
jgi:hypothetical protein